MERERGRGERERAREREGGRESARKKEAALYSRTLKVIDKAPRKQGLCLWARGGEGDYLLDHGDAVYSNIGI